MNEAKKMTVGRAWKMKTNPYLSWSARPPRIILEPSLVKPISVTNTWPRPPNRALPVLVSSTKAANAICSATPVPTSFQSTCFLLSEKSQAMASRTDRPNRPKKLGSWFRGFPKR